MRYTREYTLPDHLGNLRLAYRLGQRRTSTATLEQDPATRARETRAFDSLSVSPPVADPAGYLARTGSYAARVNAGGSSPQPLGPLKQLAVQQGDTVTVTAYGLYPQAARTTFWFSLASFLFSVLHPGPSTPTGPDPTRGRAGLPLLQVGVAAGLAALPQLPGGVPKGYLRLLVFTADSALVGQQVQQLSPAALGNYEPLRLQVIAPQDGYVTAFVGNESDADVYFDDVTVVHGQGLQVQEAHYDPFGLELAGLTGTSPGLKALSQYKFNGKEFQADLGLNWNHQDWRFFDPQLGRWHVTDPEIENGQESWTPYSFGFNNAVRYADADGRYPGSSPTAPDPTLLQQAGAASAAVITSIAEGVGTVVGGVSAATVAAAAFLTGAVIGLGYAVLHGDSGDGYGSTYSPMGIPSGQMYVAQGNLSRTGRPLPKNQTNGGRALDPDTKQPIGGNGIKARPVTVNKGTFKQAKDAARNDRANGGKGTPVKHTQDTKGGKHFHNGSGVEGKGKESKDYGANAGKVSNNVHYHYPSKASN